MSAEDWLYPITLQAIGSNHALNLVPLMDYTKHIALPACTSSGTENIQIDVVAADTSQRVLVLAECKNYISFQCVSECAEQLVLKTYLFEKYLAGSIGGPKGQTIKVEALADYHLIGYVSLGHQGPNCAIASIHSDDESKQRLDSYLDYMTRVGRCGIGILILRDKDSTPIVKRPTLRIWKEGAQ